MGGVGQSLDHLRPSGAMAGGTPLGDNCGMSLYMDRYSNSTREVQQDGRRGALMLCVSVNHPDSEKFVDKKMAPGAVTGANVSLKIRNDFMALVDKEPKENFIQTFPVDLVLTEEQKQKALLSEENILHYGDIIDGQQTYYKRINPSRLWDKLCFNAWKSAEPGILFWDTILNESPCRFYGAEWEEKGTNPCFTGDTEVLTADNRGFVSFKQLAEEGKEVEVYCESLNKVILVKKMRNIRMVAEKQKIFKITFTNGEELKTTQNHIFYLKNNEKIQLKNLKKGQHLRIVSRYKNSRGLALINKDTKNFGDLLNFIVSSVDFVGEENVYNGTVDEVNNYFVGNFQGKVSSPNRLSSSIKTANCGEIPLPPNDSCRLLLLNLYGYVSNKFTQNSIFEDVLFTDHVKKAMRLMDDIVDLEIEKVDIIIKEIEAKKFKPEFQEVELRLWKKIRQKAIDGRRTGLGITGEGDMMAALGVKYGTPEGTEFAEKLHQLLATTAYEGSIELAKERGSFPIWNKWDVRESDFLMRVFNLESNELMTEEIQKQLTTYGRRNIAILTIAPAGSVSILSQTSSGVEPIFSPWYFRKKKVTTEDYYDVVDEVGDKWVEFPVFHKPFIDFYAGITGLDFDKARSILSQLKEPELKEIFEKSPYYKATAQDVDYVEKVRMQGAIQKWIDHSISVTVNMPESVTVEMVKDVYKAAWESGCKGVTVYRDNSRGNVLSTTSDKKEKKEEFHYSDSMKRPKELECDVFFKTSRGDNFAIFVGKLDNKPYEVFAIPNNSKNSLSKSLKKATIKKEMKGCYSLRDAQGETLIHNLSDYMIENEQNSTRLISSLLRHRVEPGFVAKTILKFATINSFHQVIAKVLTTYSKKGIECPQCGGEMSMTEGCVKCTSCGYAHCG